MDAYAAAIREAHPEACHISDRFHLVKNLTDAITLYLYSVLSGRIIIPLTKEQHALNLLLTTKSSRRDKILWVKALASQGRTFQEIRSQTGCSFQTIRKYKRMHEEEIPEESADRRGQEHKEAVQKVIERAEEVRALKEKGYSIRKIADETGHTMKTINNYLASDFNPVHGQYGVQRPGKLAPFRNEVIALRSKGTTYKEIYTSICKKGYTGSEAAIRQFTAKEKRLRRDLKDEETADPTEIVERKWLVKLLYKPLDKVKAISSEQVKNVFQKYPVAGTLFRLLWEFKGILRSGKKEALHKWISDAESLNLKELVSFLNGIKKDIEAVENACILS